VKRLIAIALLVVAACGRESPPPSPRPSASAQAPSESLAAAIRQYDRDVIERLRRLPDTQLTPAKRAALARGTTLSEPASAQELDGLAARIGKPLPPSYREFLATTNGMMFEGALNQVVLLRAAEVVPLTDREYPRLRGWRAMPDAAVPGAREAGGPLPGAALDHAWVISDEHDGDIYLIFPDRATSDGEWPVWFLGDKNPGAYGYASFRAMFEREREAALRKLERRSPR